MLAKLTRPDKQMKYEAASFGGLWASAVGVGGSTLATARVVRHLSPLPRRRKDRCASAIFALN